MTQFLTCSLLDDCAPLKHGFFTRRGGVSQGIYESLNCGSGSRDIPENVTENRRRVQAALGAQYLAGVYQIHSAQVVEWPPSRNERREKGDRDNRPPQGDALVTARPGVALSILTADCSPVLLADPRAGVIGAAHAGWQGALKGILQNTVAAMRRLGAQAENIRAAIGPTIARNSYEVGPEFRDRLLRQAPEQEGLFRPAPRAGHHFFDLPAFVTTRLRDSGVSRIGDLARDTYDEADLFFSYRRTTHQGQTDYGRQISVIMLEG